LGSCYYALGKYELAKEQYKKALSINPSYVETLMNYSALDLNMGNVDEALNTILKIRMEIEPKNYRLYIIAIGKEKFNSLIEIHTEPNFENYLLRNKNNEDLLYEISVSARLSGACYEDELRIDFMNKLTNR
jgi:tetratricopeptide (TPR) repeat protein